MNIPDIYINKVKFVGKAMGAWELADLQYRYAVLTARHEQAMLVLNQIATMPRKTEAQRKASDTVNFLASMS